MAERNEGRAWTSICQHDPVGQRNWNEADELERLVGGQSSVPVGKIEGDIVLPTNPLTHDVKIVPAQSE